MKRRTRFVSMLLAACMTLSLFPVSAFASADNTGGGVDSTTATAVQAAAQENSVDSTHTFKVSTAKQLTDAVSEINKTAGEYAIELTGAITLSQDLTFNGKNTTVTITGSDPLTFQGDASLVLSDVQVTLNDLTIQAADASEKYLVNLNNRWTTLNLTGSSCIDGGNARGCVKLNGELTMHDTSCIQNGSSVNGGGVSSDVTPYGYMSASLIMSDHSSIINCTATMDGGGVYFGGPSSLQMSGYSRISGCTAGQDGGGFYGYCMGETYDDVNPGSTVLVAPASLTMADSSNITDCRANNGGGVYVSGWDYHGDPTFLMKNSSHISSCTAALDGGGIYNSLYHGYMESLTDSSYISNCTAGQNGGGIYNYASNWLCPALTDSGYITGCKAVNGGGVYSRFDFLMDKSSYITKCTATGSGGGIYAYDDAFVEDSAAVWNNTAEISAADLYIREKHEVSLSDTANTGRTYTYKNKDNSIDGWYLDSEDSRYTPTVADALDEDEINELAKTEAVALVASYGSHVLTLPASVTQLKYGYSAKKSTDSDGNITVTTVSGDKITFKKSADADVTYTYEDGTKLEPDANGIYTIVMGNKNIRVLEVQNATPVTPIDPSSKSYAILVSLPENVADTPNPVTVTVTDPSTEEPAPSEPDASAETNSVDEQSAPESQTIQIPGFAGGTLTAMAKAGQTVTLSLDESALDDGYTFGSWVVKPISTDKDATDVAVTNAANPTDATFTMPASPVTVTFTVNAPVEPEPDPEPADDGSSGLITAVVVGGTAAAGYLVGTRVWLESLYGFLPGNRIELAMALWKHADCPAPESTAPYADISENDTDVQAAARWCVEQGLMKDFVRQNDDGTETVNFKPYDYVARPYALSRWYKLEKLLNEQAGQ